MTDDATSLRRPLSKDERNSIFKETILPSILTGDRPAKNKTIAFVCGQPGAGKSTMVRQLKNKFGGERTVSISVDDYCCNLPGLNEARREGLDWGDEFAHEQDAVDGWFLSARNYAVKHNCNIILETNKDPKVYREYYATCGYKLEVYIVATNKYVSLTSVFQRAVNGFDRGSMANCAVLDKQTHDDCYAQWPKIAFDIERSLEFDKIAVATRESGVCYKNKFLKEEGRWENSSGAHKKIIELNNRKFSPEKIEDLEVAWDKIRLSDLACRSEFQSYPLGEYRREVLSHASHPGRSFDPHLVLPKDSKNDMNSYFELLVEDVNLVTKKFRERGDRAFRADMRSTYWDIVDATTRRVEVGLQMLSDINELVKQTKAEERAQEGDGPAALPGRQRKAGLASLPSSQGAAETVVSPKQPAGRLGGTGRQSSGSSYGSLDLTAGEASEREAEALVAANRKRPLASDSSEDSSAETNYVSLGLSSQDLTELEKNAVELMTARFQPDPAVPAKRLRYEPRQDDRDRDAQASR